VPVPRFLKMAGLPAALVLVVAGLAVWSGPGAARAGMSHAASGHGLSGVPVAARGPLSAALGRQERGYQVTGLHATNAGQRFGATFSRGGVTVASGSAWLRLRLAGYGRESALQKPASASPRAVENRVDYLRRGLDEWYANGPLGLEQGFDVTARPPTGSGPLSLALAMSSDLHPRIDRSGVALAGARGTLRYGGLSVSDARGRPLHSWLSLRAGRIVIRVDDRGAAYPVRIDPMIQAAELTESDGGLGSSLGVSMAVSGDTIVATGASQPGSSAPKVALYVFVRPDSGWANATQTAELTLSDINAADTLGAVAVSGDTIVAGATNHTVGAIPGAGAAYVFVKPASGWRDAHETAVLTATDLATNEGLGNAVAVSGDTIVASAPGHKVGPNDQQGAAYVFVKPAAGWKDGTQTAELTASDGATRDFLGGGVSISGDTVVLGAAGHDIGASADQGAAYVYVKPDPGWTSMTQTAELTATDGGAGDMLGLAVSVSGDTVALGAPFHQVGLRQSGAAYVFVKPSFGWAVTPHATQTAELTPSDGATNDRFGVAVGVSGDTVIAGALFHQIGGNQSQGAAYLFDKPGNTWKSITEAQELRAADGAANDILGDTVGISGNIAVASAPFHQSQGAVYLFGLPPTVTIDAPTAGATFTHGQAATASYACTAPAGATITTCTGPVASGGPIDTDAPGQHSFAVRASDSDGLTATETVTYTVVPAKGTMGHTPPKPSITALRQSASVWRTGVSPAHMNHRRNPPVGTNFSFVLNEPARATLRFTRLTPGLKLHGKCVHRSAHAKHQPRCVQRHAVGTLSLAAHQGTNHVRFQGRLAPAQTLTPSRYTVTVTASDGARQTTTSRTLTFTIVR
jgi:hypothetical protein